MKKATRRAPAEKAQPPIECGFGCGKPAEGSISVSWSDWTEATHDRRGNYIGRERSLSMYLPACYSCARGSITLKVVLPAPKKNEQCRHCGNTIERHGPLNQDHAFEA